jgi:thioredoxin-related protein
MKTLYAIITVIAALALQQAFADAPAPGDSIYDNALDGRSQIAAAQKAAKPDNKRILVEIGGDACVWCVRLHSFFADDTAVAAKLKKNFVVVLLAINKRNASLLGEYGDPYIKYGAPVIVVLDSNGQLLATKNTAELEAGKTYDTAKVIAFLDQWSKGE